MNDEITNNQLLIPYFNFQGHSRAPPDVAFSPDGKYFASSSYDSTIRLWDYSSKKLLFSFVGHKSGVTRIKFSPDSRNLVSGSVDKTVRIWDVESRRMLYTFKGYPDLINFLYYTPDGKNLISASCDGTVNVWDPETKNLIKKFDFSGNDHAIDISKDGKVLAFGTKEKFIHIWNIETDQIITLEESTGPIKSISMAYEKGLLASTSNQKMISVWNIKTKEKIHVFPGHEREITRVLLSADGKYVSSTGFFESTKLWDVEKKVLYHSFKRSSDHILFSHDSRFFLYLNGDEEVVVWDLDTKTQIKIYESVQDIVCVISLMAFSGKGNYLSIGSVDINSFIIWEFNANFFPKTIDKYSESINSLAVSQSGRYFALGLDDQTVKLIDTNSLQIINNFKINGQINFISISLDDKFIACGCVDKTIKILDIGTGIIQTELTGHEGSVNSVEFSPDGKYLLSGSDDTTIKLWDLSVGDIIYTFSENYEKKTPISVSKDFKLLACGSDYNKLKFWDIPSRKLIKEYTLPLWGGYSKSIAFSPDGKYFIVATDTTGVLVFDIESMDQLYSFIAGDVSCFDFSSDSASIVLGTEKGIISIWDVENRKWEYKNNVQTESVTNVKFSANKKYILICSKDKTIKIINYPTKELFFKYEGKTEVEYDLSPDKKFLVSKNFREIKMWKTLNGEFLESLGSHTFKIRSIAISSDGK